MSTCPPSFPQPAVRHLRDVTRGNSWSLLSYLLLADSFDSATFLCPSFSTSRALSSFLVFVLLIPFVYGFSRSSLLFTFSFFLSDEHPPRLRPPSCSLSRENRSSLSLSPAFSLAPISSREFFTCSSHLFARSLALLGFKDLPLGLLAPICLAHPSVRVSRSVSFRRVAETVSLHVLTLF